MPDNTLGFGGVTLPTPENKYSNDLNQALVSAFQRIQDNFEYLLKPLVRSITSSYVATDIDAVILANATSGGITVTLPEASTVTGKHLRVKKTDSSGNTITIDGHSSETIDGSLTRSLSSQYETIYIVSDGSNWMTL